MKKRGKKVNIDADLDEEIDNFEPESEDDFDSDERHMLNNAVGRRKNDQEVEVFKVHSSSEDSEVDDAEGEENSSEDEEVEDKALYGGGAASDMDSDIEERPKDDGLPDAKAWGSDRKQYYDTDYVDKDYLGFDDEEAAIEEEKEADSIQKRLISHLEGTDFTLGLLDVVEEKKKAAAKKRDEPEKSDEEEKVEVDLSKISHEEALKFLKRESPELFPLMKQCKTHLLYLKEKVWPILNMIDAKSLKRSKATKLIELVNKLILHYTMNVLFYLYSKEMGKSTINHPVLKRINALNSLLEEVDVLLKQINPQLVMILEANKNGEELIEVIKRVPPPQNRKEKRKRKLELLKKKEQARKINKAKKRRLNKMQNDEFVSSIEKIVSKPELINVQYEEIEEEDEDDDDRKNEGKACESDKRGVTFNILKNRGLTPRRKKENRNPRVKNRNKYRRAIKRRRGQFREPRKELTRYGGEISGIKSNISKSIKLK